MAGEHLSERLWDTFRESPALDLAVDVAEIGVDAVTTGALKEIPILGSIAGIWRAGAQFRDLMLIRKLVEFLQHLDKIPPHERIAFANKMSADAEHGRRVAENLLMALDRLDDSAKTRALAIAFEAFVRNEIGYDALSEFRLAIDRCLMADLRHLRDTSDRLEIQPAIATRLSACGLIEVSAIPTVRPSSAGNYYVITHTGARFYRIVVTKLGPELG